MIIQIRIVINVPPADEAKYPQAIEKIIETVRAEFPNLQVARPHSPVTVTIKGFDKAEKPL